MKVFKVFKIVDNKLKSIRGDSFYKIGEFTDFQNPAFAFKSRINAENLADSWPNTEIWECEVIEAGVSPYIVLSNTGRYSREEIDRFWGEKLWNNKDDPLFSGCYVVVSPDVVFCAKVKPVKMIQYTDEDDILRRE